MQAYIVPQEKHFLEITNPHSRVPVVYTVFTAGHHMLSGVSDLTFDSVHINVCYNWEINGEMFQAEDNKRRSGAREYRQARQHSA